ncbi:MAG: 50S ribosomal protein L11 methyltransferase [Betaproteobacteria bacterium]|nr:50S ribosomal protein L11 methyltransferase [Betaproteobacteria bacterium]NBY04511.1 50S ribosomal protein L11 methyltransferase [Betaproteobacteria bacterium]
MHELRLLAPQDRVEWLSQALEALDALSVSVEDADAHSDSESPLFGEPGMPPSQAAWDRSQVTALFADQAMAQAASDVLALQDLFETCQLLGITELVEQDWVRLTQSQFAPVEITPDFWIVPTWHQPPAQAQRVLRLDPGLAFGTGTHPTTRMCLRWLAHNDISGMSVLDYGCGSGILAMGACLHGATRVDAVDIDPDAVQATRLNAQANGVVLQAGLPDQVQGPYQCVLANILASPLQVLAPLLCGLVQDQGGHLVLAGILQRQAERLQQAYAPWCRLGVHDTEDGWVLMTARFGPSA